MNREMAKRCLSGASIIFDVVNAFVEGRDVQFRFPDCNSPIRKGWSDCPSPKFVLWDDEYGWCEWRVKPQPPREYWIVGGCVHVTEAQAKQHAELAANPPEIIHVREVAQED